jgi:hypothetical protein
VLFLVKSCGFSLFAGSPACVLPLSSPQQLLLRVLGPPVAFAELGLLYAATLAFSKRCRKRQWSQGVRSALARSFVRTAGAVFLFTFSEVSSAVFSFLSCVRVGAGGVDRVLKEYPDVSCGDDDYRSACLLSCSVMWHPVR